MQVDLHAQRAAWTDKLVSTGPSTLCWSEDNRPASDGSSRIRVDEWLSISRSRPFQSTSTASRYYAVISLSFCIIGQQKFNFYWAASFAVNATDSCDVWMNRVVAPRALGLLPNSVSVCRRRGSHREQLSFSLSLSLSLSLCLLCRSPINVGYAYKCVSLDTGINPTAQ